MGGDRERDTIPNHTGIIRKRDKVLIRMDSELPRVSELVDPADKLRYYRESKGFSQEQLGKMLGNRSWFIDRR